MNITLTPKSSQIVAIGYDDAHFVMRIYFGRAGTVTGVYDYPSVGPEAFEGLQNAESANGYFQAHMRRTLTTFTKLADSELETALQRLEDIRSGSVIP